MRLTTSCEYNVEEFAMMNGDLVNEVILPLMNVYRRTAAGILNSSEPHASQIMITTAGYKNTYAHEKTLETLVDMALGDPGAFCFGGDFRLPIKMGILDAKETKKKITSQSYKLESFLREYMSVKRKFMPTINFFNCWNILLGH